MQAAVNGQVSCLEALVAHGASLEAKDNVSAIQQTNTRLTCVSRHAGMHPRRDDMHAGVCFYMHASVPAALDMCLCIYST